MSLDIAELVAALQSDLDTLGELLTPGEPATGPLHSIQKHMEQLANQVGPYGLHLLGKGPRTAQLAPVVFGPHWPENLSSQKTYVARCDDDRDSRLQVVISPDGDAWVYVWENDTESGGGVRIRTLMGGGRQIRTRQALLWLAEAIRLDAESLWNPPPEKG